jgi:hypothetical protein
LVLAVWLALSQCMFCVSSHEPYPLTPYRYVTMPLDTVKTRMQSIEAKTEYKNSFHCAARVVREEGFLTLWSGAVPRLGRLILSGGIVFTMYVSHCLYKIVSLTVSLGTKRPWTCSTGSIQTRNIYKPNYAQACMLLPNFVKPCTCTCRE